MNNWISREAIVEIGLLKKQDRCAWCKGYMDIKNANIQLCRSCRKEHLDKMTNDLEAKG